MLVSGRVTSNLDVWRWHVVPGTSKSWPLTRKGNNGKYLPTIRVCVECPPLNITKTTAYLDETHHFMPKFFRWFFMTSKKQHTKKGNDMNLANPLTIVFFPLGQVFTSPDIFFHHFGESPLFTTQSQLGGETSNILDVRPDLCEKLCKFDRAAWVAKSTN